MSDAAEIEAGLENAYRTGILAGRKMERERIATAIEAERQGRWLATPDLDRAARIARTEPS